MPTLLTLAPARASGLSGQITFHVMLPWYDRLGPFALDVGFRIDALPPGAYRLKGALSPEMGIDARFEMPEGNEVVLAFDWPAEALARLSAAPPETPPVLFLTRQQQHLAHFWIGQCQSDGRLGDLLDEATFYALSDEEQDEAAISEFARSQGTKWIDHDFLEAGREAGPGPLAQRFAAWSYAQSWADQLERRAAALGISQANCFIMLGGNPDKPGNWRLDAPRDIAADGIDLKYAGEIGFMVD